MTHLKKRQRMGHISMSASLMEYEEIIQIIEHLEESIEHMDVSGFELLEILDIRSQLAAREPIMDDEEKARLEKFDQQLARHASYCADRISEVADMSEMRKGAHVLPSHWWWYIDEFRFANQRTVAG